MIDIDIDIDVVNVNWHWHLTFTYFRKSGKYVIFWKKEMEGPQP